MNNNPAGPTPAGNFHIFGRMSELKLNLGCGAVRPAGWINTDSSLTFSIEKIPVIGKPISRSFHKTQYAGTVVYMNLNKPWKYADESVDVVYSSHTFEHLSLKTTKLFLKESYRCLKPGGVIRLVVPDLYKISKRYIDEYEQGGQGDPTTFIMWAVNMHREGQYGTPGLFKKLVFEWQGYPHLHKYMYDEKSLAIRMYEAGFRDLVSLEYGVSRLIPEIKEVEGTRESYLSVYLEGVKG
jgi:predicted SAM-dependent methyltransferase